VKKFLISYLLLQVFILTASAQEMVDFIDPFIGAVTYPEHGLRGDEAVHGFGKTFPGATTPFGMVQLSPDTITGGDNGPGYSYAHHTIEGFSFTHMSGIGWYGEFGNIQVMPSDLKKSKFSHDEETASAGYYRVRLSEAGVVAEATAARTSGILRFTYEKEGTGVIRFDLARRIGELWRAKRFGRQNFKMTGLDTFAGEIICDHRDGGWGRGGGKVNYTLKFAGRLSKTPEKVDITGAHSNLVVRMAFPVIKGESVSVHIAISFDVEPLVPKDCDFDSMRLAARKKWAEALQGIEVEGGNEKTRTIFATSLYHAFIDPREIGRAELREHKFVRRTVFSGWDVFRSAFPLYTLLRPDIVSDTINSMMDTVVSGKRKTLPRWDIFACQSGCMIGQPIVSVMADAWEKGIRSFDAKLALDLAISSLEKEGNNRKLGYTPGSLSQTLEFSYADWCCARLAEMIGEKEIATKYFNYAKAYTNCWSHEVGWMRTRTKDGGWLDWKGRQKHGQGCAESNPWQQGWFVPHDITGLIKLMGGKKKFTEELSQFFSVVPDDFRWNDGYNHPNEPCHTLPFLFAFSDNEDDVGRWVHKICDNAYGTGPYGLCGNEDVGQMSAWYVLSSIGLHPICPGDGRWYLTPPLFKSVKIRLDPHYYSGKVFEIRTPNAALGNYRIKGIKLNGKPLNRRWITTKEVTNGGVLEFDVDVRDGK
jgi:predicted alpha-1,2-mannosidase